MLEVREDVVDGGRVVGSVLLKVSVEVMIIVEGGSPDSVGVEVMTEVMVEGGREVVVSDEVVGIISDEVVLDVVGGSVDEVVGGSNEVVDSVVGGRTVGSVVGSVVGMVELDIVKVYISAILKPSNGRPPQEDNSDKPRSKAGAKDCFEVNRRRSRVRIDGFGVQTMTMA